MGELHRIRDTRFGRVIVLKVLKPNLAEHSDALRRFEHEARITALLEHPGVVAVHDRGRLWDGRPCTRGRRPRCRRCTRSAGCPRRSSSCVPGWRSCRRWSMQKAARGVDERFFSWGGHFEANWSWTLNSQSGELWLSEVGRHPTDVSPYGVHGLTGNSRDWCRNRVSLTGQLGRRVVEDAREPDEDDRLLVRGGSCNSVPAYCRLAARFALRAGSGFASGSFRWSSALR
ncbi:MAG: hypothetical protein ACI9U2_004209 [Bradymonadia bacterium]|jgi:hypothetical protein